MGNKGLIIVGILLGLALFFGVRQFCHLLRDGVNSKNMHYAANLMLRTKSDNISITDIWDNFLICDYRVEKDRAIATVISAGPDGQLATEDDIKIQKYNYNKSFILGQYAQEKGKEFAKGFIDSVVEDLKEK